VDRTEQATPSAAVTPNGPERLGAALRRWALLIVLRGGEAIARFTGRRKPYGILKLELSGDLPEEESEQRFFGLLRRPADDYASLVAMLRWARDDPRLRAVLIGCEHVNASWARLQGLRRSIERLRQAGKRVWVHLNAAGIHEYYLATAAERISLTPAATLDIAGLSSEAIFLQGALEKAGVQADVVQMGRYKAVGETFTRRDMSVPHREMIESLVDDLYDQIIDGVAEGRSLAPDSVRDTFDSGPFLASEARDARLIDAVAYEDEVEAKLVEACEGAAVVERRDYAHRRAREIRRQVLQEHRGTVAVLHVGGTIKSGDSIPGPEGVNATGARSVATALKEAREREDVRAVVVRVTSPGGSGAASDLIWHELMRTRQAKPVVISCGDVAASGGYYVALAGESIVAEAGTITGSIGVVAGKASLRGLYERVGITKEFVRRGKNAGLYSDYSPLGVEERARIEAEAQSFYHGFIDKVAAARRLSVEAAAAAAEGRVWTGRQAWTRGLVDRLGDFADALDLIKERLGIPVEAPIAVETFPRPRRLFKVSLDVNIPHAGSLAEAAAILTRLEVLVRERVWAILPFSLRFR
jgi:protease-4